MTDVGYTRILISIVCGA